MLKITQQSRKVNQTIIVEKEEEFIILREIWNNIMLSPIFEGTIRIALSKLEESAHLKNKENILIKRLTPLFICLMIAVATTITFIDPYLLNKMHIEDGIVLGVAILTIIGTQTVFWFGGYRYVRVRLILKRHKKYISQIESYK